MKLEVVSIYTKTMRFCLYSESLTEHSKHYCLLKKNKMIYPKCTATQPQEFAIMLFYFEPFSNNFCSCKSLDVGRRISRSLCVHQLSFINNVRDQRSEVSFIPEK